MKRTITSLSIILSLLPGMAKTVSVNNTPGASASYTNMADALEAVADGDVIVVDGSTTSYGNITVSKKITIQGPGYLLNENNITDTGSQSAKFGTVTLGAEGVKLTGLQCENINIKKNECVITRCYLGTIQHTEAYSYNTTPISGCVIHQNYITNGIDGDNYSAAATNFQITNNIFTRRYSPSINYFDHSTISHNSFIGDSNCLNRVTNSVVEHNIGLGLSSSGTEDKNSYVGNATIPSSDYGQYTTDWTEQKVKETEAKSEPGKGAFSGDSPYVLSGVPTGPYIKSVNIPASVAQGENLNVVIEVSLSR